MPGACVQGYRKQSVWEVCMVRLGGWAVFALKRRPLMQTHAWRLLEEPFFLSIWREYVHVRAWTVRLHQRRSLIRKLWSMGKCWSYKWMWTPIYHVSRRDIFCKGRKKLHLGSAKIALTRALWRGRERERERAAPRIVDLQSLANRIGNVNARLDPLPSPFGHHARWRRPGKWREENKTLNLEVKQRNLYVGLWGS